MDKLKQGLEVLDVAVKVAIAIIGFLVLGAARNSYELQKMQYDLQQQQANVQKTQSESAKLLAEQTKALAEAQTVTRKEDTALVTMIVDLLFKQNLQCVTEDQSVMIGFLAELNDEYNKVKIGNRVTGAFTKRHACEQQSAAISADAKLVKAEVNGQIPDLSAANVKGLLFSLKQKPEFEAAAKSTNEQQKKGADGYVALGRPAGTAPPASAFTNFEYAGGPTATDVNVPAGSVWRSRWPVYLRTNSNNTDDGSNPIIGTIGERQCVRVVDAYANIRGQTWAAVSLTQCPGG
jgi:hypothetical protein